MKFQLNASLIFAPTKNDNVTCLEFKDKFEDVDYSAAIIKVRKMIKNHCRQRINSNTFSFTAELNYIKPIWRTRFQDRNRLSRQSTSKPVKGNYSPFLDEMLESD